MNDTLKISFPLDSMKSEKRAAMEKEFGAIAEKYGWEWYAQGASMESPRMRQIAFERI